MTLVRNSVRYLHGITNERNSEGRNSIPCSFVIPCRNLFAANYGSRRTLFRQGRTCSRWRTVMPVSKKFLANSFAKFYVRHEPSSRRTRLRRTLIRSGCISSRERIFWRTVRQFAAEYGRTRANPGELRRTFGVLRRTFAGVRRSVGVGEPMANSRGVCASSLEFARVHASSRRTTVCRVYCPCHACTFPRLPCEI